MLRDDVRNRLKTYNVGDVKKLHACSANLFLILKKLNDNAYIINLPKNFDISSTLNVKNLVNYKGLDFILLVDDPSP